LAATTRQRPPTRAGGAIGRNFRLLGPFVDLLLVDLAHLGHAIARPLVEIQRLVERHIGMAVGAHGDHALEKAHQVALARGFAPQIRAAHAGRHRPHLDRDVALAVAGELVGGEAKGAGDDEKRGAEDAAVFHPLDGELRVLAQLHGAALAELQLHARVAAGAQLVERLERCAGISGTARPPRSSQAGYCTASTTAGCAKAGARAKSRHDVRSSQRFHGISLPCITGAGRRWMRGRARPLAARAPKMPETVRQIKGLYRPA
jgi:hypothetical protein